jgi:diacylglycerol kinase family enzyme
MTSMADLGERSQLDEGLLHAYVIEAAERRALLALLARSALGRTDESTGWVEWAAVSFRVESRRPRLHAAIDGEPVVLEPPLEFAIRPRGLPVLLPA